jgi:hypothetical protein
VTPNVTKKQTKNATTVPPHSYDESPDEVVVWNVQFSGGQKFLPPNISSQNS